MATRIRAAHGHLGANTKYDACWCPESLGHVLQVCPRTWGTRIMRHDALMEKFLCTLESRGLLIVGAPVIRVRGGSPQIPEGVLNKGTQCWVVEASLVAGNADLDNVYWSKCNKYNTPAVRDWCQSNWNSPEIFGQVSFGALILNWRAAMSARPAYVTP